MKTLQRRYNAYCEEAKKQNKLKLSYEDYSKKLIEKMGVLDPADFLLLPQPEGYWRFLEEFCEGSATPYPSRLLYERYRVWCEAEGLPFITRNRLSLAVAELYGRGRSMRYEGKVEAGVMARPKNDCTLAVA